MKPIPNPLRRKGKAAPLPPGGDVTYTRTRRSTTATVRNLAISAAAAVLVVLGGITIAGYFAPAAAPTAAPKTALDTTATTSTAELATTSYLSFTGTSNQRGWTGTGWVAPLDVHATRVTTLGPDSALVAVQARVLVATRDAGTTATNQSAALGGTPAPGVTPPAGYTVAGTSWWPLTVVVTRDRTGALTASTPVLGSETAWARPAAATDTAVNSTQLGDDTRSWAANFLGAYAASLTQYLTTPDVTLAGLDGAVTLQEDGLRWTTAATAPDKLMGSATVTWRLAPTDIAVTQNYAVTVEKRDGRWYATGIGPQLTTTEGTS